jgi:antitoxin component of RelBE/YafQ-DinJ toxin-antitoxin module
MGKGVKRFKSRQKAPRAILYTVNAMTKKQEKERPPPKDRVVSTRIDPETYAAGQAKAEKRGSTISKIMRALFWMWAHGEGVPNKEDWPPEVSEQEVRAEKRRRKQQK